VTIDFQEDPEEASQRPMTQGGLSDWIRSKTGGITDGAELGAEAP